MLEESLSVYRLTANGMPEISTGGTPPYHRENEMSDRELLARIHDKAANYLATAKLPLPAETHVDGLFNGMEEIWNLTQEAWEQVNGPDGDDGRDFTPPYES